MRSALREMRRKRHGRLRAFYKAWKEANQYKKFMLIANMQVLTFKKDCNRSLLKSCFDALRNGKEEVKLMMVTEALEGEVTPAIESLSKENVMKEKQAVRSGRKSGVEAVKAMIYRRVAGYFFQWKGMSKREVIKMNDNFKQMIIRRWQLTYRLAFNLWRNGKAHQEITMCQTSIMEM